MGDITMQLKRAYTNVHSVLAEFGAWPDSIINETWLVTDIVDLMANVALTKSSLLGRSDSVLVCSASGTENQ